jgi:hypothetical protein
VTDSGANCIKAFKEVDANVVHVTTDVDLDSEKVEKLIVIISWHRFFTVECCFWNCLLAMSSSVIPKDSTRLRTELVRHNQKRPLQFVCPRPGNLLIALTKDMCFGCILPTTDWMAAFQHINIIGLLTPINSFIFHAVIVCDRQAYPGPIFYPQPSQYYCPREVLNVTDEACICSHKNRGISLPQD